MNEPELEFSLSKGEDFTYRVVALSFLFAAGGPIQYAGW